MEIHQEETRPRRTLQATLAATLAPSLYRINDHLAVFHMAFTMLR